MKQHCTDPKAWSEQILIAFDLLLFVCVFTINYFNFIATLFTSELFKWSEDGRRRKATCWCALCQSINIPHYRIGEFSVSFKVVEKPFVENFSHCFHKQFYWYPCKVLNLFLSNDRCIISNFTLSFSTFKWRTSHLNSYESCSEILMFSYPSRKVVMCWNCEA